MKTSPRQSLLAVRQTVPKARHAGIIDITVALFALRKGRKISRSIEPLGLTTDASDVKNQPEKRCMRNNLTITLDLQEQTKHKSEKIQDLHI